MVLESIHCTFYYFNKCRPSGKRLEGIHVNGEKQGEGKIISKKGIETRVIWKDD